MPTLTSRDGVRLHYAIEGSGPPLLLHLGAGCDAELWRAAGYLDVLTTRNTCILFDHRGHGLSDHPRGVHANHIDRFVSDITELLDLLALPAAAVWAYSSGLYVGLKLADQQPTRLTCLVGSGTIDRATAEQVRSANPLRLDEYRAHQWERMIARFEAAEGNVPPWMKARIQATDMEPVIDWWSARPDWKWDQWRALSVISTPTLFVVGELEDPEDRMAAAADLMPDGVRIRVPAKGHITAFLDSTFVLPHVSEFLAAHSC